MFCLINCRLYSCREQENQLWNFTHFRPFGVNNDPALPLVKLQKNDFCKEVVNIEGVLLNRKSNYNVCFLYFINISYY